MKGFVQKLEKAAAARRALRQDSRTTAFRWVNGEGDGLPSITVDGFEGICVLSLYDTFSAEEESARAAAVLKTFEARAVYVKRRPREAHSGAKDRSAVAPAEPHAGTATPEWEAREEGLRYRIRPAEGLAVGLYLDMRPVRAWLRARVRGKSVFNGFAYTCGFGLAARVGGASRVLNVDASRRVLDWGAENARLNGLPAPAEDFAAGEVFGRLRRLVRRGDRFDVVGLDPPSFSTVDGFRFSAAKDYRRLAASSARAVTPGGVLLACCNLSAVTPGSFESIVVGGVSDAGRRTLGIERLGASPIDFPVPPGKVPALKAAAFTLE